MSPIKLLYFHRFTSVLLISYFYYTLGKLNYLCFFNGFRESKQLVFPADSTNKHITSSQLRNNMRQVQIKAGLLQITVHDLRHTSTSLLFEAVVPMEVVKDRLGHSDIQTTMNIYTHVTKKRKLETAEDFALFMESKTKCLSNSVKQFTSS
ncbi:tyrosine-type recombinase/integrase [Fundicoccus ignavus]|uniref:tyrosine-type recombinase/integrase n=1 Tax=Fundicoccus ignavus TaxID=2664442 RepID=UPI00129CFFB6|nr:tyrosine-type recombinase/integrase [Fundicoccus ignavus]